MFEFEKKIDPKINEYIYIFNLIDINDNDLEVYKNTINNIIKNHKSFDNTLNNKFYFIYNLNNSKLKDTKYAIEHYKFMVSIENELNDYLKGTSIISNNYIIKNIIILILKKSKHKLPPYKITDNFENSIDFFKLLNKN